VGRNILEKHTVVHDRVGVLFGIDHDLVVFERIAVDEQQISVRAFFNDPKLTLLIGVKLVAGLEQLRIGRGRLTEDLEV
jgi:hypothetical protein